VRQEPALLPALQSRKGKPDHRSRKGKQRITHRDLEPEQPVLPQRPRLRKLQQPAAHIRALHFRQVLQQRFCDSGPVAPRLSCAVSSHPLITVSLQKLARLSYFILRSAHQVVQVRVHRVGAPAEVKRVRVVERRLLGKLSRDGQLVLDVAAL